MNPNDPDVIALSKAIFQHESGGDFNAVGDAGTSHGAGQWQPGTWKMQAKDVLGDENAAMTPDNQKAVVQVEVAKDKAAGLNPAQIAAKWNSGSPDGWENKIGTTTINGQQVKYNVPAYVKSVTDLYQQYKGAGGQQGGYPAPGSTPVANASSGYPAPTPPTPYAPDQGAPAPQQDGGGIVQDLKDDISGNSTKSFGDQATDAVKGVGNFLFPAVGDVYHDIKGDNTKTALQQVGDVGLTALPFIPGLGEAGEAARGTEAVAEGAGAAADAAKGTGLIGKVLGSPIAKNAAVGYGAGTAANLSNGQSIGQALTPQASNIGGAVLGGGAAAILGKLAGATGDAAAVNKVKGAWEDALGATKTGIKATSKVAARGEEDPATFLANAGIPPETSEVNGRTVFNTGEDSNTYKTVQQRTTALTDLRDKLIDTASSENLGDGMTMDKSLSSLSDLHSQISDSIKKDFYGKERDVALKHIDDEFTALSSQLGGDQVTLKDLNTVKKYFQGNTNYDTTRPSTITEANKAAASLARSQVEKDAAKSGIPGIKELNQMIRQHLDFLNTDGKKGILDKINGQTVKGGRIGVHAKEVAGSVIGAMASQSLGGGPIGDVAAGVAGGMVGNKVSRLLQKFSVGGPGMAARIGKMAQEDPALVVQLVQLLRERGQEVPEGLIAPRLVPKQNATGLVPAALTKAAIRTGSAL